MEVVLQQKKYKTNFKNPCYSEIFMCCPPLCVDTIKLNSALGQLIVVNELRSLTVHDWEAVAP